MKEHATTDSAPLSPHHAAGTAQVNTTTHNTPPANERPGKVQALTTPNPSLAGGGLRGETAGEEQRDGQIPLLVEEGPGEVLLPYVAPAIEVIEVRTEAGYALSGAPGRWDPTDW